MDNTRKVFVVENSTKHDISDAARYGEITYIYAGGEYKPPLFSSAFVNDVLLRMDKQDFDVVADYLLVAGNTAAIVVIACSIVKHFGTINLLLFDAAQEEYVQKTIT